MCLNDLWVKGLPLVAYPNIADKSSGFSTESNFRKDALVSHNTDVKNFHCHERTLANKHSQH